LSTLQRGQRLALGFPPDIIGVAEVDALRTADAAQLAGGDGDAAADLDDALQHRLPDVLVVVVAFFVAVVQLRHRSIAPVDDLDAGGAVDDASATDQHVAARGFGGHRRLESQVAEVRRLLVDRRGCFAPAVHGQRAHASHLFDERRQVLGLGFGDRVTQLDQLGFVAVVSAVGSQRGAA
jgi:hypothetical protein